MGDRIKDKMLPFTPDSAQMRPEIRLCLYKSKVPWFESQMSCAFPLFFVNFFSIFFFLGLGHTYRHLDSSSSHSSCHFAQKIGVHVAMQYGSYAHTHTRPWRIMLKNCPIMLCSNALKCFNYASKNCYYAHIMLAYNIIHKQVA